MHRAVMTTNAVHSYFAYGLGIRSALVLPELLACDADADVTLKLGHAGTLPARPTDGRLGCWATAGEFLLSEEGIGTFAVRHGREVIVDPAPGIDESRLRLSILRWVFSAILHQRGLLLLHGSAVAVNGRVAAFLGRRGSGKSTLASALYARGHSFVADDLLAVDASLTVPAVHAGFPHCKLSPDAIRSFGGNPHVGTRYHPAVEKRAWPVARNFPRQPLPLARLYVLSDGDDERIAPLQQRAAVWELVQRTYALALVDASGATPAHLRQCTEVARRGLVCCLLRHRSFASLPDTTRLVEEDLA